MKQHIAVFTLGLSLLTSCMTDSAYRKVENGLVADIRSGQAKAVKLEVISDDIIRVIASPDGKFSNQVNLIKDTKSLPAPSFQITTSGDTIIVSTQTTQARLSRETGEVRFTDANGHTILREKTNGGKEFTPIEVEGTKGYTLRQVFESEDEEGLYGLGQHQSDEFNYKGKNEELFQYNTKVSVPFIVSSKGYGVLWHNYSLSRFGDKRPYADLGDVFGLYGKDGRAGALTATYYTDKAKNSVLIQRDEDKVDYENLKTIKNLPADFPKPSASATWEGEIEAKETGTYHFKLHYAGYTKVFVNNEEIIPERWRAAWNPNDYKATADLEKGKRYPIRIEWLPDGDVSYIGLKVLSPLPEEERERLAFWSEMGDDIDYYFINGESSMDKVISGYRTVTGKSQIMPKWAMGFWLSRERYKTQEELLTALNEYRRRQVPLDVIVQDWSYWPVDAWGSHEFDKERFPDPKGMIQEIHDKDARIMISVWPKFYYTTEHYKELDALGAMYQQAIKDSICDWIYPGYIGSFYDAYNPEARKLFWEQMNEHLYSLGIDAWWMDASEPNIKDCTPMSYQKALTGPTALGPSAQYYNTYALVNAQAIYEGQLKENPDDRVFLLTRSGFAGLQRYSTASWSGDIGTRWEELKAQISAGLNFSISGIPYWTMDIGGFCVENRYRTGQLIYDKTGVENDDLKEWRELNARWYQFGTFTPLYRAHGQFPLREIYNIAPEDHPAYQTILYYNQLRYRLMPYIYSLAGKTYFDDYTIMRPLVMDYASDLAVRDNSTQYMFGPSMMIAPVYTYKATSREVYFPKGTDWYDLYTGKRYKGGQKQEVEAPFERMPIFAPSGGILLYGPEITYVNEKKPEVIDVYIYAGKDGSFYLYEDEGTNNNYQKGTYSKIDFNYSDATNTLTIGSREGSYPGMLSERTFNIIYVSPNAPAGWDNKGKPTKVIEYKGEQISVKL